jgi:hypothetical protein
MACERFGIVSVLDPKADAAEAHPTDDYVDMSKWHKCVGIFLVGVPDDTETIVISLIGYSDNSGSDATTLVTKSIAAHATDNDNKQWVLEINADQIERIGTAAGVALRYVRANMTTAVAQGEPIAALALGFDPREGPVSGLDLASVTIGGGTVS